TLVNQEGEEVRFPNRFSGHITLVGYIYTTCPDICPLTTQRMNRVAQELTGEERNRVRLAGISMDPERDTPDVLASYADAYRLQPDVWTLLSGERRTVLDLLDQLEITVRRTPTRFTDSGEMIYFLDHTDRVSLVDADGRVRRHYVGSELDVEQVVSDIRSLLRSERTS
ncbi:MAG: SCO family protein, partial [Bacteroidota bacterium]